MSYDLKVSVDKTIGTYELQLTGAEIPNIAALEKLLGKKHLHDKEHLIKMVDEAGIPVENGQIDPYIVESGEHESRTKFMTAIQLQSGTVLLMPYHEKMYEKMSITSPGFCVLTNNPDLVEADVQSVYEALGGK